MKKVLSVLILIAFILSGCSNAKNSSTKVENPYEINVKGEILSYYGDKTDFENIGFEVLNSPLKSSQSNKNNIFANSEDMIRNIVIIDKNISTYKDITVGDSVDKIESSFINEINLKTSYAVLFDGTNEIDPKNDDIKKDNCIWINYTTNGKTIEKIAIYDVLYGKEMR